MTDDLTEQLLQAVREPNLCIELSTNLFDRSPLLRLTKPGATARSKRVPLLTHVIVGDANTQRHSAMLRVIADLLEESGR